MSPSEIAINGRMTFPIKNPGQNIGKKEALKSPALLSSRIKCLLDY
jgi:hypothetical protein